MAKRGKTLGAPKGAPHHFGAMKAQAKTAEAERTKDVGPVTGGVARLRLDRPGRKRGGRVGADLSPLSTAARSCD